jgi:hypothetical protein
MIAKKLAIERLRAAGFNEEAEILAEWRNCYGNDQGWDGFAREQWPELMDIVVWQNVT